VLAEQIYDVLKDETGGKSDPNKPYLEPSEAVDSGAVAPIRRARRLITLRLTTRWSRQSIREEGVNALRLSANVMPYQSDEMDPFPEKHELISFFEVEPTLADTDVPWAYHDSTS